MVTVIVVTVVLNPTASAGVTYEYTGLPFSAVDCGHAASSAITCVDGQVTGTITFNLPEQYTGFVNDLAISSFTLAAAGVGISLDLSKCFGSALDRFIFQSGLIVNWFLSVRSDTPLCSGSSISIASNGDQASTDPRSPPIKYGRSNRGGKWTAASPPLPQGDVVAGRNSFLQKLAEFFLTVKMTNITEEDILARVIDELFEKIHGTEHLQFGSLGPYLTSEKAPISDPQNPITNPNGREPLCFTPTECEHLYLEGH